MVTKTDFDDKLKGFNKRINSNKEKHVLIENEFKKLQTFDSSYFRGKSHFVDSDGTQNLYFSQYSDILKVLVILIMF